MIFFGKNVIEEALNSNHKVVGVFISLKSKDRYGKFVELAKLKQVPVKFVDEKTLDTMSGNRDHRGLLAEIIFSYAKLTEVINKIGNSENESFIYIYDATFEQNLGAIIRTAECSGMSGVIIPNDLNITQVVAHASAGGVFHLPIIKDSVFSAIKVLKKEAFNIISIERGGSPYYDLNLLGRNLFIIGGEDKAITQQLKDKSDFLASIPQYGKINSLNMSVAAAVILYERVRQLTSQSIK